MIKVGVIIIEEDDKKISIPFERLHKPEELRNKIYEEIYNSLEDYTERGQDRAKYAAQCVVKMLCGGKNGVRSKL